MAKDYINILKAKLDKENLHKLMALQNAKVMKLVSDYVELCNPKSVFVRSDSAKDISYIRQKAIALGEERKLNIKGHTVHFDGPFDQGRDKEVTRYLVPRGCLIGSSLNSIEKNEGLLEIRGLLKNIMAGKEMFVCFFCLGPLDSEFSILAVQLTDSAYVGHSEDILYRAGYKQFKKHKGISDFFQFVHSAGELDNFVSKNIDKKRIYIDLDDQIVYSVNTQYAGNTVGLKKLALRLAIQKACHEDWLAEHMFLMGVKDLKGKKEYFCGAYPSMCGKTSTAMIDGETIVGDDITYLHVRNHKVRAVNVERGIFGIIKDVNPKDDPILFQALQEEGEVIFSNVLVDEEGIPFWSGKHSDVPKRGVNFSGEWFPGKTDSQSNEIPPSHKNARYTIRLRELKNVDANLENPAGVEVKGFIYGGRDSDTTVPLEQAFNWQHGIITKAASLESETTAATLGQEGILVFNPMSNIDFLSVPLGQYIEANLNFGARLKNPPAIFSVNYFLRNADGKFVNSTQDKRIWLKWMRLRVDHKLQALRTPTGYIPIYKDLKYLFRVVLNKVYSRNEYQQQFTLRIPEQLAKIRRIRNIYESLPDAPAVIFSELEAQEIRLQQCQRQYGDYVKPDKFKREI